MRYNQFCPNWIIPKNAKKYSYVQISKFTVLAQHNCLVGTNTLLE